MNRIIFRSSICPESVRLCRSAVRHYHGPAKFHEATKLKEVRFAVRGSETEENSLPKSKGPIAA